jgi:energy-coupling factor transport system substrate-specific component
VSSAAALALSGLALLAVGLFALEQRRLDPRALALAATLAALATAGRVLVPIPSAKPVTAICLLAGISLGPASGAAVGASTALLSNAFLGQGPWTPWQMLLWGLVGVAGGLLGPLLRRRPALVAAGVVAALAFGASMNLWQLATFGPELTVQAFVATQSASLPFDVSHAVATALVLAVIGPASIRLLDRYAVRLEGRWEPGSAREEPA